MLDKLYGQVAVPLACAGTLFGCDRDRVDERRVSDVTTTGAGAIVTSGESVDRCAAEKKIVADHLATFDYLDFTVFSQQQWDRLSRSHAQDVVVHWPDGRVTTGLGQHTEDLKAMFVYAPDTRIQVHPVKFGVDDFTSVIGVMEGTFTKPLSIYGGKTVKPTNRRFSLTMSTVGHWKDGVMDEEWLFWDNAAFMKQIGMTP